MSECPECGHLASLGLVMSAREPVPHVLGPCNLPLFQREAREPGSSSRVKCGNAHFTECTIEEATGSFISQHKPLSFSTRTRKIKTNQRLARDNDTLWFAVSMASRDTELTGHSPCILITRKAHIRTICRTYNSTFNVQSTQIYYLMIVLTTTLYSRYYHSPLSHCIWGAETVR